MIRPTTLIVIGLSSYKTSKLRAPSGGFSTPTNVVGELDFTPNADPKNPRQIGQGNLSVYPGGNQTAYDETAPDPTTTLDWITLTVAGSSGVATGLASPTTVVVMTGSQVPMPGQVLTAIGNSQMAWMDPAPQGNGTEGGISDTDRANLDALAAMLVGGHLTVDGGTSE